MDRKVKKGDRKPTAIYNAYLEITYEDLGLQKKKPILKFLTLAWQLQQQRLPVLRNHLCTLVKT
jgi:hypothetical protein